MEYAEAAEADERLARYSLTQGADVTPEQHRAGRLALATDVRAAILHKHAHAARLAN